VEGIVVLCIFLGLPWVLGTVYRSHLNHQRFMKVLQLKADMNSRLLDRVGTDANALEFLKSEAQQQMFDVRLSDPTPRIPSPYSRVLTTIQVGLMLLCGGGGMLYIRQFMTHGNDQEVFLTFGTVGVALGTGALLSAVAALVIVRVWRAAEAGQA
jgi:hypothetical protein